MRSVSCQSGPCSRMTTFLPAFASTAAKTDPDAPAPTMTTSTFSLAMSPPLGRSDVRHVRNAEAGIALHGAVDDVDGIATQDQVDEWSARPLPAFDLVLAHIVDEAALLGFAELCKRPAVVERLAGAIDRAQRRAIEIRVGRPDVEDARFEQRLVRRDRALLIDEVGYPGLARIRNQRLAERVERRGLRGRQRPQRDALCARRARREQNLGAAHREGERADCRAFHEGASFDVVHGLLPGTRSGALVIGNHRGAIRRANTLATAAVFWNGSKIQRRFRERIKRPRAASARGLFDPAAEQPLGIAVGDALGLIRGKLREPAAVGLHDGVVAEPALVDPGIGAEQEAIGMTSEELAPLGRKLAAALTDAAAVGEFAHQLGIYLQQLPHPPCRRRKSGMRPDDLGAAIVREQNQERRLVAMGEKIEITSGGEVDDPLDQRCLRGITINVELADSAEIAAFVFSLDQVVDRGIGRPILDVVARAIGAYERYHPKPRSLGVDELMGALVRTAVRQDAGDAVAPKNVEHAVERIVRVGLLSSAGLLTRFCKNSRCKTMT